MSKRTWPACACLALVVGNALGVEPEAQYKTYLTDAQTVEPSAGFGEQISLRDGQLSFRNVDIEVPGTGPTIRIIRTATVDDGIGKKVDSSNLLGEWVIEIPRLQTVTSNAEPWVRGPRSPESPVGWQVTGPDKDARCTHFGAPRDVTYGEGSIVEFPITKWWFGYQLVDDTGNVQTVFNRTTDMPNQAYKIGTSTNWIIGCLPATANGAPGEAFQAISPDGTKYNFDHLVYGGYENLTLPFEDPAGGALYFTLPRRSAAMLVTRIEDRFGNWVTYHYSGSLLTSIDASDGRKVVIERLSGSTRIKVGTGSNIRTWTYAIQSGMPAFLSQVSLPDGSDWLYTDPLTRLYFSNYEYTGCSQGYVQEPTGNRTVRVTSPSGAKATFAVSRRHFGRSYVPKYCSEPGDIHNPDAGYALYPKLWIGYALTSKTVSGAGMATQTWSYSYSPHSASWEQDCSGTSCPSTVWTDVVSPAGERTRSHFSNKWDQTENKLLKEESFTSTGVLLRTVSHTYATTPADGSNPYPWPLKIGYFSGFNVNEAVNLRWTPVRQSTITQQGATFQSTVNHFDAFARPLEVLRDSSLNTGRAEATTYHDNFTMWVLGQVAQVKCTAPTTPLPTGCGTSGTVMSSTTYDPTYALPLAYSSFGKLQQILTYDTTSSVASGQRGTVKTVTDGNNHVTTLSNWKRGIPQTIQFPVLEGEPAVGISAVVNDQGWITSTTDENNYTTNYAYDIMGRLQWITYPTGDSTAWAQTAISTVATTDAEFGITGLHWRQTITTGTNRKRTYFDAVLRPVLVQEYDLDNQAATERFMATAYAPGGEVGFASYPLADAPKMTNGQWTGYMAQGLLPPFPDCDPGEECEDEPPGPPDPPGPGGPPPASNLPGLYSYHDALGRITKVAQTSELGALNTTTEYLTGFKTRVTNPRGFATTTSYMAYDTPGTDWPVAITHPEGAYTSIVRDVFGKPTALSRNSAGNGVWNGRYYAYDQHQRLCKLSEPETGTNAMGYDDAGNLLWSASGQAWSPTGACLTAEGVAAARVDREYDARNRLLALEFPDGQGDQYWSYTPDGLPAQVSTFDAGQETINAYTYNKRRMLTGEAVSQLYGWGTWSLGYGYNANGHLSNQVYPGGLTIAYAPNALGQATKAGSFATGVTRHPNGAIHEFNYGNGIAYNMIQNARQLPAWVTATSQAMHFSYNYDANANVTAITGHVNPDDLDRTLTYDGLDRLKTAASPMWGGTLTYGYDQLDNLTTLTGAGRNLRYCYNDSKQLIFVRSNASTCSNGQAVHALDYDVQGNLASKDEADYQFDFGNRLREVTGKETYRYDALGRRVRATSPVDGDIISVYSQGGQLMFQQDYRRNVNSNYVYLDGSLVAVQEIPIGGGATTFKYQHTDALGSPVTVTSSSKVVLERFKYEPYGQRIGGALQNGPGYTGHVLDVETGLNYMQQRYYDPEIGRFLSVDPVTANPKNGSNFNRYWYAANSPYKYIDPDGRKIKVSGSRAFKREVANALDKLLATPAGAALVKQLHSSSHTFKIVASPNGKNGSGLMRDGSNELSKAQTPGVGTDGKVYFNPVSTSLPNGGVDSSGSGQRPAFIGLAHELAHAKLIDEGRYNIDNGSRLEDTTPPSEQDVLPVENQIRHENGLPERTWYYD